MDGHVLHGLAPRSLPGNGAGASHLRSAKRGLPRRPGELATRANTRFEARHVREQRSLPLLGGAREVQQGGRRLRRLSRKHLRLLKKSLPDQSEAQNEPKHLEIEAKTPQKRSFTLPSGGRKRAGGGFQ